MQIGERIYKYLEEKGMSQAEFVSRTGISQSTVCLLYTSPSPRDVEESRMPSSA